MVAPKNCSFFEKCEEFLHEKEESLHEKKNGSCQNIKPLKAECGDLFAACLGGRYWLR